MIGVIANPNARGLMRDRLLGRRLVDIVGDQGVVYETRTPDDLKGAVAEFQRLGVDVIATCGGDGTNLSTITEIIKAWRKYPGKNGHHRRVAASAVPQMEVTAESSVPIGVWPTRARRSSNLARPPRMDGQTVLAERQLPRFAILRGGTVNTVALNLGIDGAPDEILRRLIERLRSGDPVPTAEVDLLEVNGMYGFLFGAGMPGRFFEAYYGGPTTGVGWAAALATRTMMSGIVRGEFSRWMFQAVPADITVDGEVLDAHEFTLIVAATVKNVGIGVKVPYKAGTVPGRFHLIASSLPAGRLMSQFVRVFAGKPLVGTPHTDTLAKQVEIHFHSQQTYTLDGDLFRAAEVRLAAGPRLSILKP